MFLINTLALNLHWSRQLLTELNFQEVYNLSFDNFAQRMCQLNFYSAAVKTFALFAPTEFYF